MKDNYKSNGFTLVELVIVIAIVGILAAFAIPRFVNLRESAKIASLNAVAGALRSIIYQVKSAAVAQGLSPTGSNPGSGQSNYIVTTNLGSFEVDWRNLCPESIAEMGDRLRITDFLDLSSDFQTNVTNQSAWIGYDLPPGNCYVVYDSFACTVSIVTSSC